MPEKINIELVKVEHIKEISKIFTTILENNDIHIYIDLANAINLYKTSAILYKSVPSLRTKIITQTKSMNGNDVFNIDEILEDINKLYKLNNKLFITSNDENIIIKINELFPKSAILDEHLFYLNIAEEKNKTIGICLKI